MESTVLIVALLASCIVATAAVQILIIRHRGTPVPAPNIPRGMQTTGQGTPITYAIMGDSTAISQGSQYNDGFAVASINHLAKKFQVTSTNTGTSGATVTDVLANQIPTVTDIHPTIVLLSIGANDATHFTKGTVIRDTMQRIIDALKQSNHDVAIIITGSPAMDSVTRFPIGSKQLMGLRTRRLNAIFDELARKNDLIFAPIAEKTRDAFIADPTLTASDQFHPNKRGYALWIPVINAALDAAIKR